LAGPWPCPVARITNPATFSKFYKKREVMQKSTKESEEGQEYPFNHVILISGTYQKRQIDGFVGRDTLFTM
jgi:CO dehydrogenase/acetyl-CoA synthase beta subunit